MQGHACSDKKHNKEPRETNCGIGDDMLVPACSPKNNHKSVDGDGLGGNVVKLV